jgi:hypothetical protein
MMVRVPRDRRDLSERPCARDGCPNMLPVSAAVQARYCSSRCQRQAHRDRKAKG